MEAHLKTDAVPFLQIISNMLKITIFYKEFSS